MVATTNRVAEFFNGRTQAIGMLPAPTLIRIADKRMWAYSVLDGARFDNNTDRVLYLHGDLDEADAAYPHAEIIDALGVDIVALAECFDLGCISPEQIGQLVVSVENGCLEVRDFDTAISILSLRTPRQRDLSVDDLDFGAMLDFGVDTDAVDECLFVGGITPDQVAMLTESLGAGRLDPADFNTAVTVMHDEVACG